MRKLALIALAPIALAACSQEAAAPAEEPAATETEAAAMTTSNGSPAGTYDVMNAEGEKIGQTMIGADGTYKDMGVDGTVNEEGTFAVADGKICFTSNEEGATADCWTESAADENGTFTATADEDGRVVTVTPAAATTEAAPAEEAEPAA